MSTTYYPIQEILNGIITGDTRQVLKKFPSASFNPAYVRDIIVPRMQREHGMFYEPKIIQHL
jgi:hypothetical protein